ncbi:MAG: transposase [Thermoanaerobaculia bacterium]|nr:transposase [Thermoanaerobaculia bacterium]
MARPLRVEYVGGCYHVINRGNYRRTLFDGGGAGEAFVRTLGEAAQRFHWRVHAYVVMRNHFHLAVELTEPNLSLGMKWLQGTWIRRYNGMRRLVGRPFQGRYKALLVEPGHAFGQVCHYIHLNPVRAGVVPAARIASFALSSLPGLVAGKKKREPWLECSTVLAQAGGLADRKAGWDSYLRYLEFLATDEASRKKLVAGEMSRGWCLGSREFRKEQREEAARRGAELDQARFEGLELSEIQPEREAAWEEQLRRLARSGGIDLQRLGPRKSDAPKVLLAAAMKQSTSVSNGWLAARLGMGKPASVSQFTRRLVLREDGSGAVSAILSRVNT